MLQRFNTPCLPSWASSPILLLVSMLLLNPGTLLHLSPGSQLYRNSIRQESLSRTENRTSSPYLCPRTLQGTALASLFKSAPDNLHVEMVHAPLFARKNIEPNTNALHLAFSGLPVQPTTAHFLHPANTGSLGNGNRSPHPY